MNQMTSYQVEAFGRPLAQVVRDIPTPQGKEVVIKGRVILIQPHV